MSAARLPIVNHIKYIVASRLRFVLCFYLRALLFITFYSIVVLTKTNRYLCPLGKQTVNSYVNNNLHTTCIITIKMGLRFYKIQLSLRITSISKSGETNFYRNYINDYKGPDSLNNIKRVNKNKNAGAFIPSQCDA